MKNKQNENDFYSSVNIIKMLLKTKIGRQALAGVSMATSAFFGIIGIMLFCTKTEELYKELEPEHKKKDEPPKLPQNEKESIAQKEVSNDPPN